MGKIYQTIRIESEVLDSLRRLQGYFLLAEGKKYSYSDVIARLIKETEIEIAGVKVKRRVENGK